MKHWFFYIQIPKDKIKEIPLLQTILGSDGTVTHSMSLKDRGFIHTSPDLDESEDGSCLYGLYAWTSTKETADLFRESRSPVYFTCKKMDIPVETMEWEALRSTYKDCEIIRTSYSDDDDKNYSIPMTHFESDIICDNTSEVTEMIVNQLIDERYLKRKEDDSFRAVLDIFDSSLAEALDLLAWSELIVSYGFMGAEICMLGHFADDPEYIIESFYNMSCIGLGFISKSEMYPYELDPVSAYIFMLGELLNDG